MNFYARAEHKIRVVVDLWPKIAEICYPQGWISATGVVITTVATEESTFSSTIPDEVDGNKIAAYRPCFIGIRRNVFMLRTAFILLQHVRMTGIRILQKTFYAIYLLMSWSCVKS